MDKTNGSTSGSVDWEEVLPQIPGYDPFATAGDCVFDPKAADHVVGFFQDCLTHVKGEHAGAPLVLGPWQQAVVGNLFGWKRPDGTRRYREALIFVPRKNGKTILAAGLALYSFFCDGEPGAEVYCAAADRDQARLLWDVARRQILHEPALQESCRLYQHSIVIEELGASFKAISADAATKHGYNSHFVVVDELHAQRPPAADGLPHDLGLRAGLDLQREARVRGQGQGRRHRGPVVPAGRVRSFARR
jgi:phage terminase large subunit-like protein